MWGRNDVLIELFEIDKTEIPEEYHAYFEYRGHQKGKQVWYINFWNFP